MTDLRLIEGGKGGGNPPPAPPSPAARMDKREIKAILDALPEQEYQNVLELTKAMSGQPIDDPDSDARILHAETRASAIVACWNAIPGPGLDDEASSEFGDLVNACYNLVAITPAHTPEGMAAKVRLLSEGIDSGAADWNMTAARSLLADLNRMAGAS